MTVTSENATNLGKWHKMFPFWANSFGTLMVEVAMSRGLNRSERLKELERLYVQRGFTDIEMGERLGVTRTTAYKDRILLETQVPLTKDKDGRWRIDRSRYISEIRVDLYEALVLYLAARRSSRQHQLAGKHAANGVEKLATALHQPMTQRLVKTADVILSQKGVGERTAVLETIARAWAENIKVRLTYRALESSQTKTHLVTPYLIEPSHWSDSTYLIGHSDLNDDIIPFKIERIEQATLTTEQFDPPDNFDEQTLLRHAWGIWYADKDPITVKLRFAPGRATRRLKESVWHPSEEVTDLENGGCVWKAKVDEWREMLPWVRSWGADVEVLEPVALREKLIKETLGLANIYQLSSTEKGNPIMNIFEQYLTLRGKTAPELTIFEHSSDVYHIALYLLEANKEVVQNPDLVKAGALLHDVGKIEQDIRQKQWVHQPHSSKYLQPLLDHPRLQMLLTENGIEINNVKYDDLLLICEHHHDIPTRPDLLRLNPDALLVSVADVLASSLEGGWLGDIREMLQSSPYTKLNTVLLRNLDLDAGLDGEIHRIDLPADSIPNALLADLIYRDMCIELREREMIPLLQKHGSLWVKAGLASLEEFLEEYTVNPRQLYQSANIDDDVFESMLSSPAMPPAGVLEPSNMRFLLLNERIAQQLAASIVLRKTTKNAMEHFDISVREVADIFQAHGIADSLLDEENDND